MTSEENPKRDGTTPDNEPETNGRADTSPAGKSEGPPIAAGDAPSGVPGVAATDTLGEDKDDTYVARVARGAGISTAGQGIGRVLGYFALLAIARLFGPTAQGFYQAGVAVLLMAGQSADHRPARKDAVHVALSSVPNRLR